VSDITETFEYLINGTTLQETVILLTEKVRQFHASNFLQKDSKEVMLEKCIQSSILFISMHSVLSFTEFKAAYRDN